MAGSPVSRAAAISQHFSCVEITGQGGKKKKKKRRRDAARRSSQSVQDAAACLTLGGRVSLMVAKIKDGRFAPICSNFRAPTPSSRTLTLPQSIFLTPNNQNDSHSPKKKKKKKVISVLMAPLFHYIFGIIWQKIVSNFYQFESRALFQPVFTDLT